MNLTPMEKFTPLRKITREPEYVLSLWNYVGEAWEGFVTLHEWLRLISDGLMMF